MNYTCVQLLLYRYRLRIYASLFFIFVHRSDAKYQQFAYLVILRNSRLGNIAVAEKRKEKGKGKRINFETNCIGQHANAVAAVAASALAGHELDRFNSRL